MPNGKRKGGAFEREIAKTLSLWITHGKEKDLLHRSQSSGAESTINKSKTHGGDLSLYNHESKYAKDGQRFIRVICVECKHYKEGNFIREWYGKGSHMKKWWIKLCEEASRCSKYPMLIVRINNTSDMVFFQNQGNPDLFGLTRYILARDGEQFNVVGFLLEDMLKGNVGDVIGLIAS
jgi:hypothetical protein